MELPEKYILDFIASFVNILGEMAPFLLLGFFFAGILYAFIPQQKINRYLGGKSLRSSFNAALFGVPLPICSCGVIPTGISLYKNGASKGSTNSFLISTPQTGIDSILVTYSLLGLPFALIRPVIAFITGVIGGVITEKVESEKEQRVIQEDIQRKHLNFKEKLMLAYRYGFVIFFKDIAKWLIIGLVLAAVISVLIPDQFFANQSMPILLQMALVLVFSVPLYVCATASVPLAAVLILKGFSPGAALILLMAGPATNAAAITMIGKVLGRKSMFSYLGTIIVGAVLFGLMIDFLLPAHWFTTIATEHLGHAHHHQVGWLEITSAIVLLLLIVYGYLEDKIIKTKKQNMNAQTITVEGMSCNHCKASVEKELNKMETINTANVNLAEKTVTIEGENLDLNVIKETINELGFKCD